NGRAAGTARRGPGQHRPGEAAAQTRTPGPGGDGGPGLQYGRAPVSIRVRIRGLAHGGEGVGQQDDGLTWFVPGALAGELAGVEAGRRTARWARARRVSAAEPAAEGVAAPCRLADRCGCCAWQRLAEARQREHKRATVADRLRALVADPAPVRLGDVGGSGRHYRRRA